MCSIRNFYKITDDAEITLEVNPGTISKEKVATYVKAGINRFSIGLQTANDKMLKKLTEFII